MRVDRNLRLMTLFTLCSNAMFVIGVIVPYYNDVMGLSFRDFLLDAPSMFSRLGDQLGAVQHIVSYWRFRFGPGVPPVNVEELMDIFMDFETGLMGRGPDEFDPRDIAA